MRKYDLYVLKNAGGAAHQQRNASMANGETMAAPSGSRTVIYAALIGNFLIAVMKFAAAAFTGSSAMLSEGVHSLVDTCNGSLLLYGMHRAKKPADHVQPFGHARELYFWSFIVALLIFALGAGVSIYQGVTQMLHPEPIHNHIVNYAVICGSMIFEGISWFLALKAFRRSKGKQGYIEAVRESKDPRIFIILLEDSAALLGLLVALAGIAAAQLFEMPQLDGAASIGIALILGSTSIFLARESKGLLIGESASTKIESALLAIAQADEVVQKAHSIVTVHFGPSDIMAGLSIEFEDDMKAPDIEACIVRLEKRVTSEIPEIKTIFVKPQTVRKGQLEKLSLDAPVDSSEAQE